MIQEMQIRMNMEWTSGLRQGFIFKGTPRFLRDLLDLVSVE